MSYGRGPPAIEGMVSLKVDNLTYRTTPEDLRHAFEKYGEVGDVYIPRDRFTRESRGFAFVRWARLRYQMQSPKFHPLSFQVSAWYMVSSDPQIKQQGFLPWVLSGPSGEYVGQQKSVDQRKLSLVSCNITWAFSFSGSMTNETPRMPWTRWTARSSMVGSCAYRRRATAARTTRTVATGVPAGTLRQDYQPQTHSFSIVLCRASVRWNVLGRLKIFVNSRPSIQCAMRVRVFKKGRFHCLTESPREHPCSDFCQYLCRASHHLPCRSYSRSRSRSRSPRRRRRSASRSRSRSYSRSRSRSPRNNRAESRSKSRSPSKSPRRSRWVFWCVVPYAWSLSIRTHGWGWGLLCALQTSSPLVQWRSISCWGKCWVGPYAAGGGQ